MPFANRADAGRHLATRLAHLQGGDVVVLGLPRGGVPVGAQIAQRLGAPLDVIVVRKLGVPAQPELGMGAIGEDGVRMVNERVVRLTGTSLRQLDDVEANERALLERRVRSLRALYPRVDLNGKTAVIVDDGIATGSTAMAACEVARAHGAARVVLAVPVAPPEAIERLALVADEVVSLEAPAAMVAVGQWYTDFSPTSDDEVLALLGRARADGRARPVATGAAATVDADVAAGPLGLPGRLRVPADPVGVVVFAHGSGSSRHSPRNRAVAEALVGRGLATLLVDLLTPAEEVDRANVFDIDLLGGRLTGVTRWLWRHAATRGLPVGYFGASTGAAAALWAAAEPDVQVAAIVSRGGRPDLAKTRLTAVDAPTLLIVGALDDAVLALNIKAERRLHCEHRLEVVPGATHLFEEAGALDAVARLAGDWFTAHLAATPVTLSFSTGGPTEPHPS